jgi:predicted dehydrogenase
MKFLVVGLGSMGKRRIRNLLALSEKEIIGFDVRADRALEAANLYGIETVSDFQTIGAIESFGAMIISVPPDLHHVYMDIAVTNNIPCFVEASVVDDHLIEILKRANQKQVLIAPSCTLHFHPAVSLIRELVSTGGLGMISNIIYHSGQFLPDWHVYESPADYYVSNPATGGAREIVPFELTWLTKVFGFPTDVCAMFKKTIDIPGAENIDDTYNLLLDYSQFILNLNVDVVSRVATRKLTINGSEKQLYWNWDDNAIQIFDAEKGEWQTHSYQLKEAEAGYNKNISEQMYIDEVANFISAIEGGSKFQNTLENDLKVLRILYAAEASYKQKTFIKI